MAGSLETIIEGETGRMVEPGNAQALSSAIAAIAQLPESERRAMGERARAHISDQYSSDVMRDETLRVYRELLA